MTYSNEGPRSWLGARALALPRIMAHAPRGFFPIVNQGEAAILFCFVFLLLAAAGPGAWSIDGWRRRSQSGD